MPVTGPFLQNAGLEPGLKFANYVANSNETFVA